MTHEAHDAGHPEPEEHEADRDFRETERRRALALSIREDDIDPETGMLGRALAVPYLPDFLNGSTNGLLRWATLAPWGPSILTVMLMRVRPRDSWMLATVRQHPMDTWFAVLGEVPNPLVGDRTHVARLVDRVIARNGIPGHVLWRDVLPTHVRTTDRYFSPPEVRELVFAMARHVSASIMRQAVEDLRTYWLDPWDRCAAEMRRAAERRGGPPLRYDDLADRELMEEWWSLVSHPDHVRVEDAQLDVAWKGRMRLPHPRPGEAA